jgi:hypothetical protein
MHVYTMSTDSDSFIYEVLKLYDTNDKLKTFNHVQQIHVFDFENANMESSSSNSQEKEVHQPLMLPDAKESDNIK